MNWIETLSNPSVFGAPNSIVVGFVFGVVVLAGSAAVKYGQDQFRGPIPRQERQALRTEARAQRNALNGDRVGRGVSTGGQFAKRSRNDADVNL